MSDACVSPMGRGVWVPAFAGTTQERFSFQTAADTTSRSRGAFPPELCWKISLPSDQRAQGIPGARCTRGLVCKFVRKKRTRAYRFSGGNPAFPAQWFYGLYRALLGDRAFLPPSPALLSANLTPASGRQDHTSSPSASSALVSSTISVHRIPPPTSVTIAKRPSVWDGMAMDIVVIWGRHQPC